MFSCDTMGKSYKWCTVFNAVTSFLFSNLKKRNSFQNLAIFLLKRNKWPAKHPRATGRAGGTTVEKNLRSFQFIYHLWLWQAARYTWGKSCWRTDSRSSLLDVQMILLRPGTWIGLVRWFPLPLQLSLWFVFVYIELDLAAPAQDKFGLNSWPLSFCLDDPVLKNSKLFLGFLWTPS